RRGHHWPGHLCRLWLPDHGDVIRPSREHCARSFNTIKSARKERCSVIGELEFSARIIEFAQEHPVDQVGRKLKPVTVAPLADNLQSEFLLRRKTVRLNQLGRCDRCGRGYKDLRRIGGAQL